jgi:transcription elongation GreA/GreB family factor
MKAVLDKIAIEKLTNTICLGSLIKTNKASYFLAISTGKITIENADYYAVSTNSPIGKELLGKCIGDRIPFNEAEILEVY